MSEPVQPSTPAVAVEVDVARSGKRSRLFVPVVVESVVLGFILLYAVFSLAGNVFGGLFDSTGAKTSQVAHVAGQLQAYGNLGGFTGVTKATADVTQSAFSRSQTVDWAFDYDNLYADVKNNGGNWQAAEGDKFVDDVRTRAVKLGFTCAPAASADTDSVVDATSVAPLRLACDDADSQVTIYAYATPTDYDTALDSGSFRLEVVAG